MKRSIGVRLPIQLYAKLEKEAIAQCRTITSLVIYIISEYFKNGNKYN